MIRRLATITRVSHLQATLLAVSMVVAQHGPPLDGPIPGTIRLEPPHDSCRLWTSVEQLARQAGFVAGFENERRCLPAPTTFVAGDRALVFEGATQREILDALVARQPAFAWEARDGVIVVRPATATDEGTVLDRPVAPFRVRGVHAQEALQTVLRSATPSLFEPHERAVPSVSAKRLIDPGAATRIDAPIDVAFSAGTLTDALNAVALAVGGTWQAAYVNDRLHISLQTLAYEEGVTSVVSARLQ
jgi:hypothetical protein